MAIDLTNIYSLTSFRQNPKEHVTKLKNSTTPLVLTINGQATLVVSSVDSYQKTLDRLRELEDEVRELKAKALEAAVAVGFDEAERGEFSTRSFSQIIEDTEREAASKR